MRLTCPACGAVSSMEGLLNHDAARGAIAQAFALYAPLGPALLRYMALFRPAKRQLTWDRVATLLEELQPMIEAEQIERNRKTYHMPRASWVAGIEQILAQRDKLSLPLKSHGYLLEILVGLHEKAERDAVAQKEALKRGETPVGTSAAHRPAFPSPPAGEGQGEGGKPHRSSPESVAAMAAAKSIVSQGGKSNA